MMNRYTFNVSDMMGDLHGMNITVSTEAGSLEAAQESCKPHAQEVINEYAIDDEPELELTLESIEVNV
jgi:hypothetical protein